MRRELAPLECRSRDNLLLIETGVGVENVERRLHARLQGAGVGAVLGIGLAGSLSPVLKVSDLVLGQEVLGSSRLTPSPQLLSLAKEVRIEGTAIFPGTVLTVNDMVCTAKGKRRLASRVEQPIACVDMESWAVARFCTSLQIPFLIVRSISDGFDEDLPLNFSRHRRADGNLDFVRIGASALIRPRSLGGLWRLGRRARLCTRHLAQFVEQMILKVL